jgi:hypothetical protein
VIEREQGNALTALAVAIYHVSSSVVSISRLFWGYVLGLCKRVIVETTQTRRDCAITARRSLNYWSLVVVKLGIIAEDNRDIEEENNCSLSVLNLLLAPPVLED